ncbi:MAG: IclR family transcriptional regulator [Kiritimatiellia bacterium]|jgi:DNA-binding IclR family transcriptional regulator|nr:IclR family transcriptional regulator [Kiritimatiellia bacterium]
MTARKTKYDVPSLKTGFDLIEILSHHPRGKMLTELAETLQCPVSSTYRIAVALENMNVVTRDPETKQIRLTGKLLQIGQRAITETNLVEHALDVMRELRDQVTDTVLIGVREGTEVIILDEALGTRMFAFISKLGFRVGVSCCAPGKAILAHLPEREQAAVLQQITFIKHNARTITSKDRLRRELAAVTAQGYAFDDAEQFEGVYCVGAPVFDRGGYPIAAVWITGLMMDLDRTRLPQLGATVRAHADRISARLGFGMVGTDTGGQA